MFLLFSDIASDTCEFTDTSQGEYAHTHTHNHTHTLFIPFKERHMLPKNSIAHPECTPN